MESLRSMDPEEEKENKNQKQQAIGKVLFWIYSLNMDNRGGGRAETEIWGEKKKDTQSFVYHH